MMVCVRVRTGRKFPFIYSLLPMILQVPERAAQDYQEARQGCTPEPRGAGAVHGVEAIGKNELCMRGSVIAARGSMKSALYILYSTRRLLYTSSSFFPERNSLSLVRLGWLAGDCEHSHFTSSSVELWHSFAMGCGQEVSSDGLINPQDAFENNRSSRLKKCETNYDFLPFPSSAARTTRSCRT